MNVGLRTLGLEGAAKNWLGSPGLALWVVIAVHFWNTFGYSFILLLAGLSAVPGDVVESAQIDGASTLRTCLQILFPMLLPVFITTTILSFMGKMRAFHIVWVLTNGGPMHATETVATYVQKRAFGWVSLDLGYPSAIAVFWFILVIVGVTLINRWLQRKVRPERVSAMTAKRNRMIRDILVTVVLGLFTLVVLIPFVWIILMSFRTTGEILAELYGLPSALRWENYSKLLFDPQIAFYRYILNSVAVTFGALAITLVLSTLGGYGFARRRYAFRYRDLLFMILLLSLMLPPQAMYIPQFIMMSRYRLLNTLTSLVLLYAAYAVTISTYLLKTYFSQLPEELEESARMDGAGDLLIFGRIMLPLARPVIATIILINFKEFWNELLIALTMVTKQELRDASAWR